VCLWVCLCVNIRKGRYLKMCLCYSEQISVCVCIEERVLEQVRDYEKEREGEREREREREKENN
jgi:hypothetical protein